MVYLYNIFIFLYAVAIRIVSLWDQKARIWVKGRSNVFSDLAKQIEPDTVKTWIHCASAGEFEQAKPIIEALKKEFPQNKIIVSFFSPSGFISASNYKLADVLCYLPIDTVPNARKFIDITNPKLVIFIKYEFWFHYLSLVNEKGIACILVSAIFRRDQIFFKKWASFYKRILFFFNHIFVQDIHSYSLLKDNGISFCTVSGDTRFDRVNNISLNSDSFPIIENFIYNHQVIIAGSTWPDDETLLKSLNLSKMKLIIAPHEISEQNILSIEKRFKGSVRYSRFNESNKHLSVLIIDNVGMLSKIYRYATIAYIGGGFTKSGIHNILEAAVYFKPVIFGPRYQKYKEAIDLLEENGAFSFTNKEELNEILDHLLNNKKALWEAGQKAGEYVSKNKGATQKVIYYIEANRLLTN